MRIKLYWVFLHGGIEQIWEGRYNQRTGVAVGRTGTKTINIIQVVVKDRDVRVTGVEFDGEQRGTVWRRSKQLLEVEFFAGS